MNDHYKKYKIRKANVIDLFNSYKLNRGNIQDGVEIEFLEKKVSLLKEDKYKFAVVGELKAGKSTFINALLGAELLPADVLQATNAIVEIFKSDVSYLKVKYADGKEEDIYDDLKTENIDEAKERLNEICKISDEYRAIPTTLLDDVIVDSENTIILDDNLVKKLEEESNFKLIDKKELMQKYIKEHPKNTIHREIHFGFPLKWDFDELRIIDSPGVNAIGGVQNKTLNFFEDANAIIFVKRINPVESQSFKDLVNQVIPDRSKDTLFLILTHAGKDAESDIERMQKETIRLYNGIIPEERILVVDSLLQLIYKELSDGKDLNEIEEESEIKNIILSYYKKKAVKEGRDLIDIVKEASRFDKMFDTINKFSMSAPYLQLKEILDKIIDGYQQQEKIHNDNIGLLETKRKEPQKFESEIVRIKESLEKYKNLSLDLNEKINRKYSGKDCEWIKEFNKITTKCEQELRNATYINSLRKIVTDGINELEDLINSTSNEIKNELLNGLNEIGRKFQSEVNVTVPRIDVSAIIEKTKQGAFRNEPFYGTRSVDFWDFITFGIARTLRNNQVIVGEEKVFDAQLHLEKSKNDCIKEYHRIHTNLYRKIGDVCDKYTENANKEIAFEIEERKKDLDRIIKEKKSNNEIIIEIKGIETKKNKIPDEIKKVEEIIEDIKCLAN